MLLRLIEDGKPREVPIREGEILLLPGHVRHSPRRPEPGSVGLVVEKVRPRDVNDGFVKDLPPLFEAFYSGRRQCPQCGAIHPGQA